MIRFLYYWTAFWFAYGVHTGDIWFIAINLIIGLQVTYDLTMQKRGK